MEFSCHILLIVAQSLTERVTYIALKTLLVYMYLDTKRFLFNESGSIAQLYSAKWDRKLS
jgi:hypothetical protein